MSHRALVLAAVCCACAWGDDDVLEPAGGGAGGGAGDPDEFDVPDAPICDETIPIMVTVVQSIPDLLLVVDDSGSMSNYLTQGTPPTKWTIMAETVGAPGSSCGAGTIDVGIGPQHGELIVSALEAALPHGGTPTHSSIDAPKPTSRASP